MASEVRGVVATAKGTPVTVETVIVPDPGPGEVVVKVQACGVCHTDLHYKEGAINDDFPFLLGHEAAGVVETVGPDVANVVPGDYVVLAWRAPCGRCRSCRRGRAWYCFDSANATQKMTLADGTPLSPALGIGAFVEKTLVAAGQAVKIDPAARPEAAGLIGCGVMAGFGAAVNTGGVGRGDTVAVFGCGGVGDAAIAASSAGRRPHGHRGRHRRPQARVGPGVRRHPHRELPGDRPGGGHQGPHRRLRGRRRHRGRRSPRGLPPGLLRPRPGRRRGAGGGAVAHHDRRGPHDRVLRAGRGPEPSWYGDCLPTRDFPILIDLYLSGRFDLDRFVSETIDLDHVEDAFAAMQRGDVLRSVVVF